MTPGDGSGLLVGSGDAACGAETLAELHKSARGVVPPGAANPPHPPAPPSPPGFACRQHS